MRDWLSRLGRRLLRHGRHDLAALESERRMYRVLVEKSLVGVYLIQDGRFAYVNPRLAEIFGYDNREQVIGLPVPALVYEPDRPVVMENIRRRTEGEVDAIQYEFRGQRRDGRPIDVEVRGARTEWQGRPAVIGTLLDLTQHKRDSRTLQMTADALANTAEAVMILDAEHRLLLVNRAYTQITGYPEAESLGRTPEHLRSGHHTEQFYEALWRKVDENGWWQGEVWFRRRDGTVFPSLLSASLVRDSADGEERYVIVFSDITRYKQYEERLQFLAHHDPLTRLPNRELFQQQLGEALLRADPRRGLAVLLVDLDDFKHVNDSLGHSIGDELLLAVAGRLRGALPEAALIARLGGDEYAVLLENPDSGEAPAMAARKIIQALAEPFVIGDQELFTSASVGISRYPEDGDDPSALLRQADAAMYRAKEEGRNTWQFFSSELNARAVETLTIANRLRKSVEREEFFVEYQPIIELASGRLTGVEALLRWRHPELGLVPPVRFIPVAEQTGLILEIGDWVLEEACRQAAAWRRAGHPPLLMAVNLSLRQLRQRDLPRRVEQVLRRTGLDPAFLKLEITETTVMDNPGRAIRMFADIADMGVKIAIDDFGVGYSSLSYLKRLPIDYLKIDRSFVSDLPEDENDSAITHAVVAMARSLGLRLVAEGIETRAQLDFLNGIGCQEGQGYYFSRPTLPADLEPVLGAGRLP